MKSNSWPESLLQSASDTVITLLYINDFYKTASLTGGGFTVHGEWIMLHVFLVDSSESKITPA